MLQYRPWVVSATRKVTRQPSFRVKPQEISMLDENRYAPFVRHGWVLFVRRKIRFVGFVFGDGRSFTFPENHQQVSVISDNNVVS